MHGAHWRQARPRSRPEAREGYIRQLLLGCHRLLLLKWLLRCNFLSHSTRLHTYPQPLIEFDLFKPRRPRRTHTHTDTSSSLSAFDAEAAGCVEAEAIAPPFELVAVG